MNLKIEPELWRGLEITREPQRCIWGYPPLLLNNSQNASCGHAEGQCQTIDGEPQRLHEIFAKMLSRMYRHWRESAGCWKRSLAPRHVYTSSIPVASDHYISILRGAYYVNLNL